jgi:hypothetical protein
MSVHIGSIIKEFCEINHISAPELGKRVGMNSSSIYRIFERPNLDSENLVKFSAALKHDLFHYFMEQKAPAADAENFKLKEELNALKNEVEELKRKNEALQHENELLNKFFEKIKPA